MNISQKINLLRIAHERSKSLDDAIKGFDLLRAALSSPLSSSSVFSAEESLPEKVGNYLVWMKEFDDDGNVDKQYWYVLKWNGSIGWVKFKGVVAFWSHLPDDPT